MKWCRTDKECQNYDPSLPFCTEGTCDSVQSPPIASTAPPTASTTVTECLSSRACKDYSNPLCTDGKCTPALCKYNSDCKDPTKPKCLNHRCTDRECDSGYTDCPISQFMYFPVCNNGKCEESEACVSHSDCKKENATFCQSGRCSETHCRSDLDCSTYSLHFCDKGGICRKR